MKLIFLAITVILFTGCNASDVTEKSNVSSSVESSSSSANNITSTANVRAIKVSGTEGSYNFSVTLESFDEGCSYFADWWEVLRADGSLVYRRILFHSHVSEQPFTRSGGSVNIQENEVVYIRAHMNKNGYGPNQFIGSIATGFSEIENNKEIDTDIELLEPQAAGCAF